MKRILLAVCGLTPQVITETLYALYFRGQMPHAIRILTTRQGKAACHAALFHPADGAYYRFLQEYGLDPAAIDFSPYHLLIPRDASGRVPDDIVDEEENEYFLQLCMEQAFAATRHNDTQVFFSIAGGRKTMGACLSLAAQCYGRPQDRLFHVLVSAEFERNPDFFFPPRQSQEIILRDAQGNPYRKETRFAKVTLVTMPFFSIRNYLTAGHLQHPKTPASLLLALVREAKPELTINLPAKTLSWKGVECDLMPTQLAIYTFFALHKQRAQCNVADCAKCSECFLTLPEILSHGEAIADLYRKIDPERDHDAMRSTGIQALDAENFNAYKSKLRRRLERAFGPQEAARLAIISHGRRPNTRYGLALPRKQLRILFP